MNIHITEEATAWYKKEYEIETGNIRFFVRYGGFGGNIPGFSLGVALENPVNIHASKEVDDMLFFIDEADAWYFDNKDLQITINHQLFEPQFAYQ